MLYLSYVIGAAFYLIAFGEQVTLIMGWTNATNVFPWNASGSWVTIVVASIALLILFAVTLTGMLMSIRVLLVIMLTLAAALIISMICLLWGTV
jgi:hypothetical protein